MTRFSEVTYNKKHQTATLGAGLIWDEVYAELAPHKVNALGGRATGIGVAGFILGGGAPLLTPLWGISHYLILIIIRVLVEIQPAWTNNRYCCGLRIGETRWDHSSSYERFAPRFVLRAKGALINLSA